MSSGMEFPFLISDKAFWDAISLWVQTSTCELLYINSGHMLDPLQILLSRQFVGLGRLRASRWIFSSSPTIATRPDHLFKYGTHHINRRLLPSLLVAQPVRLRIAPLIWVLWKIIWISTPCRLTSQPAYQPPQRLFTKPMASLRANYIQRPQPDNILSAR